MAKCSCGLVHSGIGDLDYTAHLMDGRHNRIMEPKVPPLYVKPQSTGVFDDPDFRFRACSVCGQTFRSIKQYRDHHYKGKCGGYI